MSSPAHSFDLHLPASHTALAQLPEPKRVFQHLLMCLETPRPSNREGSKAELKAITDKLIEFGKVNNLDAAVDDAGNVRLRKGASPGYEQATKIVLQSHMDIVCITPIVDGNKLRADRTTLGADDGIGVAASMAILEINDPEFVHGPLEAVFTVDEETTMGGAENIGKAPFLQSTVMINVDSEEASSICVGCAGGFEKKLLLPVARSSVSGGKVAVNVHIHSLLGGHTGIDIMAGRANALIVVARMLKAAFKVTSPELLSLNGGNAPNAIPRDVRFSVALAPEEVQPFRQSIQQTLERVMKEYASIERCEAPDSTPANLKYVSPMKMDLTENAATGHACSLADTKKIVNLMLSTPHGPIKVSVELNYAVETSISFSLASLPATPESEDVFTLHTFCRSSYDEDMLDVESRLESLAELAGCKTTSRFNYFPGWDPKLDSPALKQVIETHKKLFQSEPRVYSVHAGLECGLFKLAYPELDCVSIGPTIHGAHSPDECLMIDTVAPFYDWLKASIVAIAKDSTHKQ